MVSHGREKPCVLRVHLEKQPVGCVPAVSCLAEFISAHSSSTTPVRARLHHPLHGSANGLARPGTARDPWAKPGWGFAWHSPGGKQHRRLRAAKINQPRRFPPAGRLALPSPTAQDVAVCCLHIQSRQEARFLSLLLFGSFLPGMLQQNKGAGSRAGAAAPALQLCAGQGTWGCVLEGLLGTDTCW